ncbi:hypothetical protein HN018_19280 [Lichenicola cladoniae]|uniref:Uncharacterized protein n=1 Tax=Lichenicola cladoniae TaxID=1484109 RepID=A0A6M8HU43_9PROT|nr:hypothetical protein [Lichenicola cladoniae]NPD68289.1 hypothetical protein [Acetobacteraceae bacterium]QKE91888.1 hypothetical protein HN018_19280 [Lichenicola cladoniae]
MPPDTANVTREVLYEQVWSTPMLRLAKDYGVSSNALAKTCRKLAIPVPARGYWAKQQNGKKVPSKPPLPPVSQPHQNMATITRTVPATLELEPQSDPVLVACVRSFEVEENRIRVSDELRKPHPAVRPARPLHPAGRDPYGRHNTIPDEPKSLSVSVVKEHQDRALRILDALVKALEERGYPVTAEGVLIEGHTVKLGILGKQDRTPHIPTSAERQDEARWGKKVPLWDYFPSSLLTIHSDSYVWWRRDLRKRWSDTRSARLEGMLDNILIGLVALGVAMRQREDEQQAEAERRAELARQREDREYQERLTLARRDDITAAARSFSDAGLVCRLIEAVEMRGKADGLLPPLEAWLQRAREVAVGLDPLSDGLEQMVDRHDRTAAEEAERKKPAPRPHWA